MFPRQVKQSFSGGWSLCLILQSHSPIPSAQTKWGLDKHPLQKEHAGETFLDALKIFKWNRIHLHTIYNKQVYCKTKSDQINVTLHHKYMV